jgi:hypothetical protein
VEAVRLRIAACADRLPMTHCNDETVRSLQGRLQPDAPAGMGRRLYVFGVTFSALFLLGVLLVLIVAADFGRTAKPTDAAEATDSRRAAGQSSLYAEFHKARVEVSRAHEKLNSAELNLFHFLDEQFVNSGDHGSMPTAAPTVNREATEPDARSNFERLELRRQLGELQQRRIDLLSRLTPSHPVFQDLNLAIAELERRIEAKSPDIAGPGLQAASVPMVSAEGGRQIRAAAKQRYQELLIAAGRERREYEAALQSERSSWNAYSGAAIGGAASRSSGVGKPAETPRPFLAVAVLALMSAGWGIGAAAAVRRVTATFHSASEIESELELPVLGNLAFAGSGSTATTPVPPADPAWVRRTVAIGEVVLVVCIGLVVLLALVNMPFLRRLMADPVSGIFEGIAKLRGLIGK